MEDNDGEEASSQIAQLAESVGLNDQDASAADVSQQKGSQPDSAAQSRASVAQTQTQSSAVDFAQKTTRRPDRTLRKTVPTGAAEVRSPSSRSDAANANAALKSLRERLTQRATR